MERTFQSGKKFVKKCKPCQEHKNRRSCGLLPPKRVETIVVPWETDHIDLIRPYTVTAQQIQPEGEIKEIELKLTAMTMVDPARGTILQH